jgi:hypothetical protein
LAWAGHGLASKRPTTRRAVARRGVVAWRQSSLQVRHGKRAETQVMAGSRHGVHSEIWSQHIRFSLQKGCCSPTRLAEWEEP